MSDTIVITIRQRHRKSLLSNLKNISELALLNRELADFLPRAISGGSVDRQIPSVDYWPPDKSRKKPIKSAIS